jgi:hypothetical protein
MKILSQDIPGRGFNRARSEYKLEDNAQRKTVAVKGGFRTDVSLAGQDLLYENRKDLKWKSEKFLQFLTF